jgi:hypothetical protein
VNFSGDFQTRSSRLRRETARARAKADPARVIRGSSFAKKPSSCLPFFCPIRCDRSAVIVPSASPFLPRKPRLTRKFYPGGEIRMTDYKSVLPSHPTDYKSVLRHPQASPAFLRPAATPRSTDKIFSVVTPCQSTPYDNPKRISLQSGH